MDGRGNGHEQRCHYQLPLKRKSKREVINRFESVNVNELKIFLCGSTLKQAPKRKFTSIVVEMLLSLSLWAVGFD